MDNDSSFLKYLIDEEIYLINESGQNEITDPKPAKESESFKNVVFENTTVIFLDYHRKQGLPELYQDFLSKILKSVELDPEKVEMIYSEDLKNYTEDSFEECKVIAFLSKAPDNLSTLMESEKYKIKTTQSNTFFLCDSLEAINEDTTLKRKLWDQLKMLFNIQ